MNTAFRFFLAGLIVLTMVNGVQSQSAPVAAPGVDAVAGKRVVFLGDSITQAGGYVSFTTYYLEKLHPAKNFDILGMGLASETLSGLSEDGHAGGKFPRPCLFERLGRLLDKAKPEVVFACYGMNDGIYQPLDDARFTVFKKGVAKLIDQCKEAGVKEIYLITPPIYDFTPKDKEFNYDTVLTAYAQWLTELKTPGVRVVDLHIAMRKARDARAEPFSKDRVHPGDEGHLLMARAVLAALGVKPREETVAAIKNDPLYKLVAEKRALRSGQWMKHVGYTREAVVAPQPLGTVEADAAKTQEKIDALRRADRWQTLEQELAEYRRQLDTTRKEYGGTYALPAVPFFLFGMGERQKFLYRKGELRDARTNKLVRRWNVAEELIVPSAFTVALKTVDGGLVFLSEDEDAVWLEEKGSERVALSKGKVALPDFADHRYPAVIKVLHQEPLVNVVDGKPLPNFMVYAKPWYRDGAMMAMAFQKTGNLHLVKDWILGLREPFDRNNNNGETEADNLGQALYLVSLASDKSHPLVAAVQKELKRFEKGKHLEGRSDFAPYPVYQTKWAKFGLTALGLEDPYEVPQVADSYAVLFWWQYKNLDKAGQTVRDSPDYPYLTWAGAHYTGQKKGKLSDRDYPLTWEAKASQADYAGIRWIDPAFEKVRVCAPHTWHAAEAFLYLLEEKPLPKGGQGK